MSKLKVAQDGPAAETPKKKQGTTLAEKIEIAKNLEKQIKAREVFSQKLIEVQDTQAEIEASPREGWQSESEYRVILEQGNYSKKVILSFSQRALLEDFLRFMHKEITAHIAKVEKSINSVRL